MLSNILYLFFQLNIHGRGEMYVWKNSKFSMEKDMNYLGNNGKFVLQRAP
jgi:hypothetical protein